MPVPGPAPPREGVLVQGALSGVLRNVHVGRRTGLLHIRHGAERGSVCFVQGQIVYGDTTIEECHMGDTLVRYGMLSPEDLQRALAAMRAEGRRLGQVLLDMGLLDPERLQEALALQVREMLRCVFAWREGTYGFEERTPDAFRGYDRPLPLSTGEVVLDAVWSITDPEVLRYALGNLDRPLAATADPFLRSQPVTLTSIDGFLLSRVDGTLSARQVLELAPVSAEEAHRSLLGLLCIGMLEYATAAAPAGKATPAVPEPPAPPPAAPPPAPDPAVARQELQQVVARAEEDYAAGRHWDVLQALGDDLLAGLTGRLASRARLLRARCYLKDPDRQRRAEEELRTVIRDDPGNHEACYLLGTIYRAGGAKVLAAGMFRRALELRPRHTEARAELEALEGVPEAPAAGLLGRLLKRT
jgi:tetratricopeptide (TPR) repeat protein